MKLGKFELNCLYCGDCSELIKDVPDGSVDCVITSPPYNKGFYDKHTPHKSDVWRQRRIEYGNFKDNLEPKYYIKQQINILNELVRIIKPKGSIFYNHKSLIYKHKAIFPEYVFKFNLRQIIIWNRKSTPQIAPIRFLPTTEYIFWITKTNVQPKFSNKELIFKSDVWTLSPKPTKNFPAPFPLEIPKNCILATTDKNDIVFDPFMGSGTTAVACRKLNRHFLGFEINSEYVKMANRRLETVQVSML